MLATMIRVGFTALAVIGFGGCSSQGEYVGTSVSVDSSLTAATGTVGLIGCSMTVDAVEGYRRVGGTSFWRPRALGYGGGTVARWSDPEDTRQLWKHFDETLAGEPDTSSIWWQLCTDGSSEDDLNHALMVFEEISARLPSALVYVSAQPGYTDGHVCRSAGKDGPVLMAELATAVVEHSSAQLGPVLSDLRPEQLTDTCHAEVAAKEQMGSELKSFFDNRAAALDRS